MDVNGQDHICKQTYALLIAPVKPSEKTYKKMCNSFDEKQGKRWMRCLILLFFFVSMHLRKGSHDLKTKKKKTNKKEVCPKMRWPGIEPGSIAWKATMLTIIPPTLLVNKTSQLIVSIPKGPCIDNRMFYLHHDMGKFPRKET